MTYKYSTITELPGTLVTDMQLRRAHQRYMYAKEYCDGGNILELGCGGGQGLELLSNNANAIIGCDIDENNLEKAKSIYSSHSKITLKNMDAEKLLLDDHSINTIILFETIYYINQVRLFFLEAYRILKQNGYIIICTANKDWPYFNPSPYSVQYYSVPELYNIASSFGFDVKMYGSFPDFHDTTISKVISYIKQAAIKFNVMPTTMKGKVLLKEIFIGNMVKYPDKLTEDLFAYIPPSPISHNTIDRIHTAIFAVCKKL